MADRGEQRRARILREVMGQGRVSVARLAQELGVTTETVRKDAALLEEKGAIAKGHGFLSAVTLVGEDPFAEKVGVDVAAKAAAAERAYRLIRPDTCIYLDGSTTCLSLARLLTVDSGLTVATNSLAVCHALGGSENEVLLLGGVFRPMSDACHGPWATSLARSLTFDAAFLGCDGFAPEGPTISAYEELGLKQAVMEGAARAYVLATAAKFSQRGRFAFCAYGDLAAVVADAAGPCAIPALSDALF